VSELGKLQPTQVLGTGEDPDPGDPSVGDGEGEHPGRLAVPGRHHPGVPFTSTGRAERARQAKPSAWEATAAAPRTTLVPPAVSARTTTSGSSRASSAWKSPSREAARNASTTARCRPRSAPGPDGARPWTRRRARLASCRAAATDRPTSGAISSKGTANRSWSTKATRSGRPPSSGSSRREPRARSMSRQTRATKVVSQPPKLSRLSGSVRCRRSWATARSRGRWASNRSASRSRSSMVTFPRRGPSAR
jgi:hypothetical protein